ncbi:hypothetical protein Tco_1250022, partial [Tanacetum coccineum]
IVTIRETTVIEENEIDMNVIEDDLNETTGMFFFVAVRCFNYGNESGKLFKLGNETTE